MKTDRRKQILPILSSINRKGIDTLCAWLESSDFFTAPASTRFHLCEAGGLAKHSWNVYCIFKEKCGRYDLKLPDDSIALCGLLHDVCKIGVYKKGRRNVKVDGKWIEKEVWEYNDEFPYGHGEKSVLLIGKHIELSDEEAMIIRWHMGFSEPKEILRTFNSAVDLYPAIIAMHCADLEAANIVEVQDPGQ